VSELANRLEFIFGIDASSMSTLLTALGFAFVFAATLNIIVRTQKEFREGVKFSKRIAVIGAPRAGKTSLIAVLIDSIMSSDLARYTSVLGTETVDRVSRTIASIRAGIPLAPTTDSEVFNYRYLISKPLLGVIPIKYEMEFADFPGEYSDELGSSLASFDSFAGLYKKQFFDWIVRSDAYVFAVDVSELGIEKNEEGFLYLTRTTLSIKNAVLLLKQELLDKSVYRRPCALVFTKSDVYPENSEHGLLSKEQEARVMEEFQELLQFLKNNFQKFEVFFHSSYRANAAANAVTYRINRFLAP
jgi:GTPase involved in cell partitioning and DNA repair